MSKTDTAEARIERLDVSAFTLPTDGPGGEESDGTLVWTSTTMIVVEVRVAGIIGLGYTYGDAAVAHFIDSKLKSLVEGHPLHVASLWRAQMDAIRNDGQSGIAALAVAAVDIALWDARARLLGLPLFELLGPFHDRVPVYGSGGFCNYPIDRLTKQLAGWIEQGMSSVKIKVSRDPAADPPRLDACRSTIGADRELMVDSNGALSRKQALYWAERFRAEWAVSWFEEPVSSDDREGLRLLRDHGPAGLDIAAGEYGFVLGDFVDLLDAGAVDCLQADVTRCVGITGLRQVAALAAAHQVDLSAHCAPAVSTHAFCAIERPRHVELFHDHVRFEQIMFDGIPSPKAGTLAPDPSRPGLGLELKRRDAEPYRVYGGRV